MYGVRMGIYMCVRVHMHVCTHMEARRTTGIFALSLSALFLDTGSLSELDSRLATLRPSDPPVANPKALGL